MTTKTKCKTNMFKFKAEEITPSKIIDVMAVAEKLKMYESQLCSLR